MKEIERKLHEILDILTTKENRSHPNSRAIARTIQLALLLIEEKS